MSLRITSLILPFFLSFIIFFVIAVRTVGLLNNNALFIFDSARDFLYVKKIAVDHKPILIGPASGGLQGYFQGVLWYYMLAIPFALSGGNPISGTWFMAIMSTLSVCGAFFILKKVMNMYAAVLGALFLGFSEYSVATSQFIWNPYPIVWLMPFYFLGIYLLTKRSKWGILIISAIHGLLLHFEVIYGLGTLPAYVILLAFYLKQKPIRVRRLKYTVIAVVLFLLPMLPALLFDLRHQFLISKAIVKTFQTGGSNISHKPDEIPNSLPKRLALRFDDLTKYSIGSVTKNVYINYALFGLLVIGSIVVMRTKKKEKDLIILILATCVIVSPFFVFLLLKYNVWGYYWIGNAPLYAMFLAFTIGYLAQKYRLLLPFAGLCLLLFLLAQPWRALPYWYKGNLVQGPQTLSTQLNVVETIYKDAGREQFSAYEQTPPVYDYVYRYLFWWQGSRVYGYIPTDQKQKIVYVILEGVRDDPSATFFEKNTLHLTTTQVGEFRFASQWPIVKKFVTDPHEQPVDPNFFPPL